MGSDFLRHISFHVSASATHEDQVPRLGSGFAFSRIILYTNLGCASSRFDEGHISLVVVPLWCIWMACRHVVSFSDIWEHSGSKFHLGTDLSIRSATFKFGLIPLLLLSLMLWFSMFGIHLSRITFTGSPFTILHTHSYAGISYTSIMLDHSQDGCVPLRASKKVVLRKYIPFMTFPHMLSILFWSLHAVLVSMAWLKVWISWNPIPIFSDIVILSHFLQCSLLSFPFCPRQNCVISVAISWHQVFGSLKNVMA